MRQYGTGAFEALLPKVATERLCWQANIQQNSRNAPPTAQVAMSLNALQPFTRCASFDDLPPAVLDTWRENAPTPMQQPEWMISWWNAFSSHNHQLHLLHDACEPDAAPQSILPLFSRRTWTFGNTLRLLASGSACSDFQSFISRDTHHATEIFSSTLESDINRWEVIEFEGHTESNPSIEKAISTLESRGYQIQHTELESTWRLHLNEGFDGFMRNVSKTQRRQNRNLLNRFDGNAALTFRTVDCPEEHPTALKKLVDLHQLRWQAVNRKGCFSDHRFLEFIKEATGKLCERGQCSISLLELEGDAVAASLCLRKPKTGGDELYLYQTGRNPAHDSQRFGHLLCLLFLRWATEQNAAFVDYLRGDEIYKSRLGATPSKCLRTRAFAPHLLPQLRQSALQIGKQLSNRSSAWRQFLTSK